MRPAERFGLANLVVAAVGFGHALETWPPIAAISLFLGGAAIAFVGEFAVVATGLLTHTIKPRVFGVPIPVIVAWPAVVYGCLRIALLFLPPGPLAAGAAAVLGTAIDLVLDPIGVSRGVWRYPDHVLSRPRFRRVPWWNFAGWLLIITATAMVPLTVGFAA